MFTTASVLDINYGTHVSSEPNKIMKQTCNDFIKSKKTNTIKDIFVIASEHINNDIQEKRVNNDCKLIFSENKKNAKDLSPRELNAIRNKFSEYLFNNDVTIISGSSNVGKCYETTQQFLKAHEDLNCLKVEMFPNDQPHDEGCISVIYNKKFAWKR